MSRSAKRKDITRSYSRPSKINIIFKIIDISSKSNNNFKSGDWCVLIAC
jgi:hypothetical protein